MDGDSETSDPLSRPERQSTDHDLATTAQAALLRALDLQGTYEVVSPGQRKPSRKRQNDNATDGSGHNRVTESTCEPLHVGHTAGKIQEVDSQKINQKRDGNGPATYATQQNRPPHLPHNQARTSYTSQHSVRSLPLLATSVSTSSQKLPAMRPDSSDGPARSPRQSHNLPGFTEIMGLNELAEAASHNDRKGHSAEMAHRQSFSSIEGGPGHSPPLLLTQFPGLQRSPVRMHPQFQGQNQRSSGSPPRAINQSPLGAYTDGPSPQISRAHPAYTSYSQRRQSQLSDSSSPQYPLPPPATSTTSSHPATDGYTPSSNSVPTPCDQDMTFDGTKPVLSMSNGVIPGSITLQGYPCTYPGCTAAPFQTQYLLTSHANVHSSARPHYCPKAGCPRGEGGKGFKRKNEMIRHGLVHDSPGYACPFCPEREHKYPRPDNLQRHVKMHHGDKGKDDPALREILAQRAEGGSKGRRRRLGS